MLTVSSGNLRRYFVVLAIVLVFTIQGVSSSNPATLQRASVTEWAVPTSGSGPWALAVDQSGTCCWFVEYYGNKIALSVPASDHAPNAPSISVSGCCQVSQRKTCILLKCSISPEKFLSGQRLNLISSSLPAEDPEPFSVRLRKGLLNWLVKLAPFSTMLLDSSSAASILASLQGRRRHLR